MSNITLTGAGVNALRPRPSDYDIRDAKLRGFGVRVIPSVERPSPLSRSATQQRRPIAARSRATAHAGTAGPSSRRTEAAGLAG